MTDDPDDRPDLSDLAQAFLEAKGRLSHEIEEHSSRIPLDAQEEADRVAQRLAHEIAMRRPR